MSQDQQQDGHPVFRHPDGTTCIWLGSEWFIPFDVGGEGQGCPLTHPNDARVVTLEGEVASWVALLGLRTEALNRVTATRDRYKAERDDLQQRLAKVQALRDRWATGKGPALEWNVPLSTRYADALDAVLAAPAVSSRPGMTVTEAVADALNDHRENTGQITGGTPRWDNEADALFVDAARRSTPPQEPQQADEAWGICSATGPHASHRVSDRWYPYTCCGRDAQRLVMWPTLQQEPVERITDANGDELEHGADTDAQTAQQQDRSDR